MSSCLMPTTNYVIGQCRLILALRSIYSSQGSGFFSDIILTRLRIISSTFVPHRMPNREITCCVRWQSSWWKIMTSRSVAATLPVPQSCDVTQSAKVAGRCRYRYKPTNASAVSDQIHHHGNDLSQNTYVRQLKLIFSESEKRYPASKWRFCDYGAINNCSTYLLTYLLTT